MIGIRQPRTLAWLLLLGLVTITGEEERFPGVIGLGDTYHPRPAYDNVTGEDVVKDVRGVLPKNASVPWVEAVSWRPRAFVYHNFLSGPECDHLVAISKPLMRRSTVVGADGKSTQDNIRTSYGTFLRRKRDAVVTRIEQRLADWTHLPVTHQEDMQILRYGHGQKYGAHFDSLVEQTPRIATVLIYLQDTEEGGETAFPKGSTWMDPSMAERYGPFSECAHGHVAVRPKKGTALLFYSLQPDAKVQDDASMHTGCPVLGKSTKWSATKWIHTAPFHPEWLREGLAEEELPRPEDCSDDHDKCKDWAKSGECEKNPDWMLGSGSQKGHCRLACQNCERCAAGDNACRSRNRVAAGFLPLEDI